MKSKQFVAIFFTFSVVVAYVQHASITFNRRQRSIQIASAGNDLTDILLTTEYDIQTGKQYVGSKQVVKTVSDFSTSKSTRATTDTSPNDLDNILSPIKGYIETGKDSFQDSLQHKPFLLTATPTDDGKALPLGNYIKATISGELTNNNGFPTEDSFTWDAAVANMNLMNDNLFKLIVKEPPDFTRFHLHPLSRDVSEAVVQYFKNLPADAKPWIAVATGAVLVIFGAQTKKSSSSGDSKNIQIKPDALGGLTDELGKLQTRMKKLEANGLDLDSKLTDAKLKLTQKELDISKERLRAADISLNLGREIDMLKQKLKENDLKVVDLDKELMNARKECEILGKQLDKFEEKEVRITKDDAREIHEVEDAVAGNTKTVYSKELSPIKSKPKTVEKLLKSSNEAKPSPKKIAARKNASMKPVVALKIASSKDVVTDALEELPTTKTPAEKRHPKKTRNKSRSKKTTTTVTKRRVVKKGTKMKNTKITKIVTEVGSKVSTKKSFRKDDLTTLSTSALSRKTVKELKKFLESKGLSVVGKDGKPLKKAGLLESVSSLSK